MVVTQGLLCPSHVRYDLTRTPYAATQGSAVIPKPQPGSLSYGGIANGSWSKERAVEERVGEIAIAAGGAEEAAPETH